MRVNKFITNKDDNMVTHKNKKRVMTDEELKLIFGEGRDPNHVDYECLIDSKANVQDVYTKEYMQQVLQGYHGSSPEIALEWYEAEMLRRASEDIREENEIDRIALYSEFLPIKNEVVELKSDILEIRDEVDTSIIEMDQLKADTEQVKISTEQTRLDTEQVKSSTESVKQATELVKLNTEQVKSETELVKQSTEQVKINTEQVKNSAESKIIDCENRMAFIEDSFDDLVSGTGFATFEYVDNIANTKADKLEVDADIDNISNIKADKSNTYTKSEVDVKIDNIVAGGSGTNVSYGTTVTTEGWTLDTVLNLYYVDVLHELETKRVLPSMIDSDTNDSVLDAYKILDDNTIRFYCATTINAMITIINGNATTEIAYAKIDDVNVLSGRTWSSSKIKEYVDNSTPEIPDPIAGNISIADTNNNFVSTTVEGALNEVGTDIGNLSTLSTTNKSNIVSSINELFQNVDNGKSLIASAITDQGIETSNNDTFSEMANNIRDIVVSPLPSQYPISNCFVPAEMDRSSNVTSFSPSSRVTRKNARYYFSSNKLYKFDFNTERLEGVSKPSNLTSLGGQYIEECDRLYRFNSGYDETPTVYYYDFKTNLVVNCKNYPFKRTLWGIGTVNNIVYIISGRASSSSSTMDNYKYNWITDTYTAIIRTTVNGISDGVRNCASNDCLYMLLGSTMAIYNTLTNTFSFDNDKIIDINSSSKPFFYEGKIFNLYDNSYNSPLRLQIYDTVEKTFKRICTPVSGVNSSFDNNSFDAFGINDLIYVVGVEDVCVSDFIYIP